MPTGGKEEVPAEGGDVAQKDQTNLQHARKLIDYLSRVSCIMRSLAGSCNAENSQDNRIGAYRHPISRSVIQKLMDVLPSFFLEFQENQLGNVLQQFAQEHSRGLDFYTIFSTDIDTCTEEEFTNLLIALSVFEKWGDFLRQHVYENIRMSGPISMGEIREVMQMLPCADESIHSRKASPSLLDGVEKKFIAVSGKIGGVSGEENTILTQRNLPLYLARFYGTSADKYLKIPLIIDGESVLLQKDDGHTCVLLHNGKLTTYSTVHGCIADLVELGISAHMIDEVAKKDGIKRVLGTAVDRTSNYCPAVLEDSDGRFYLKAYPHKTHEHAIFFLRNGDKIPLTSVSIVRNVENLDAGFAIYGTVERANEPQWYLLGTSGNLYTQNIHNDVIRFLEDQIHHNMKDHGEQNGASVYVEKISEGVLTKCRVHLRGEDAGDKSYICDILYASDGGMMALRSKDKDFSYGSF